jgi:D-alanine-D-alanine ligase
VFPSDISPSDLSGLLRPVDVVFPVLHGQFGESGELQDILEQRGVPFVGSGSVASRAGMNKDQAKTIWKRNGLPTAQHEVVIASGDIGSAVGHIGAPCVVKPIDSGSSIDVFICRTTEEAIRHAETVLSRHGEVMIEAFIQGSEITVGIFEDRPLSPIRITTTREFFDYQAKYVGNDAQHHFDLSLPAATVDELKKTALAAHLALGCRDLSRVDFIVDQNNRPWLLEINTMPGFTPKSLLPEAAAHDGIPFKRLVDRLVCRAYARGGVVRRQAV